MKKFFLFAASSIFFISCLSKPIPIEPNKRFVRVTELNYGEADQRYIHVIFFYDEKIPRVVLNLGGIANVTVLSNKCDIFAFDIIPY